MFSLVKMNSATTIMKLKRKDHAKLKKYAKKHGLSMIDCLGDMLSKLEVRKLESETPVSKEIELDICEECNAEVPSDSKFCPQCGVEFDDEDEDDEETEE